MIYTLKDPVIFNDEPVKEIAVHPLTAGHILDARKKAESVFIVDTPAGAVPVVADSRHTLQVELLKAQCSALSVRPLPDKVLRSLSERDLEGLEACVELSVKAQENAVKKNGE